MKTWDKPELAELDITKTENGFFDVNWEGPFDILCGDKKEQKPSTPDDDNNDTPNKLS